MFSRMGCQSGVPGGTYSPKKYPSAPPPPGVTPRDSRSQVKPHVWLRSFGQVNDLYSSTDLQCTCIQWRILADSGFTECTSLTIHRTDSPTPNMVDGGVTKISLSDPHLIRKKSTPQFCKNSSSKA